MGKKSEGIEAQVRTGQILSANDITELKELKAASATRPLTMQEENRLFVLGQKNATRTRVVE